MALISILLVLLPLFPFLFLLLTRRANTKLPPGPYRLPVIGNLLQVGKIPHHSLFHLSQKHGPLMYLQLGSVPTIVASSSATAKEVLKTFDAQCCSRPPLTSWKKLSYGFSDIGFAPYGDQWRELRKICMAELFSTRKVHQFRPIREEEIGRMVSSIRHGCTVNLSEELLLLANNITCRAALGRRYEGNGALPQIVKEAQAMLGGFFFADYMPVLGWLDVFTGMRKRLEKNFLDLDGFYEQVIKDHLDRMMGKQGRGELDAVDALLLAQKDATDLTKEHIKGVLMNIFLAGTDPSSSTMEWAMVELMKHPQAMKKVQDEVRGLLGRKGRVEETNLDKLHYLECVVKEVMRLHPASPVLIPRETMEQCRIGGYDVPAKTRVILNAWAIGREEGSWEKPEEFWPERFINSHIDFKGHDFQLIPFGAGRRICPGMYSGVLLIKLALANLLYCFDWELPIGMQQEDINMDEAPGITVHRKFSLMLVASKYI